MPWTRPAWKAVARLGVALWFAWSAPGSATGTDDPRVVRRGHDAVRVAGTVTYDGPIPDPIPIPEAGTVRPQIEVDPETKGLKDAVIWLEGAPTMAGAARKAPEEPVVMDQQNDSFVPHVMAVEAGREVEFHNSDAANHGVTASSLDSDNRFNVTSPPGGRYTHRGRS